jgi:hypothetical protein
MAHGRLPQNPKTISSFSFHFSRDHSQPPAMPDDGTSARQRKDGGAVMDPFTGARVCLSCGSVEWSHGGALRAKSTRTRG